MQRPLCKTLNFQLSLTTQSSRHLRTINSLLTFNKHRRREYEKQMVDAAGTELERLRLKYDDEIVNKRVALGRHTVDRRANAQYMWWDDSEYFSSQPKVLQSASDYVIKNTDITEQPIATNFYQLERKLVMRRMAKQLIKGLNEIKEYEQCKQVVDEQHQRELDDYLKLKPKAKGTLSAQDLMS